MSTKFQAPFCSECGGPLKKWPTRTEPVQCDFCGSTVFGVEDVLRKMATEYNNIYKEYLQISREFPDTVPVGDDVRIFRVPIPSDGTHFDVLVVLREYPERISLDYPRGLQNLIGPPRYLKSLAEWIPNHSKPLDVLREIQDTLTGQKFIKPADQVPRVESWDAIAKQFEVQNLGKDQKKVFLHTSRTNFELNFYLKGDAMNVKLSDKLLRALPEAQPLEIRYNNGEVSLADFLGRLEYGVNTQDRIITEIQMLRNNYTNLRYHPHIRQIGVTIPVDGTSLQLLVTIPPRFPIIRPSVTLASGVSNAKVKQAIEERLAMATAMWNRHMHILDLLSEVQAAIIGGTYQR